MVRKYLLAFLLPYRQIGKRTTFDHPSFPPVILIL